MNKKELRPYICEQRIFQRDIFRDDLSREDADALREYTDNSVEDKDGLRFDM